MNRFSAHYAGTCAGRDSIFGISFLGENDAISSIARHHHHCDEFDMKTKRCMANIRKYRNTGTMVAPLLAASDNDDTNNHSHSSPLCSPLSSISPNSASFDTSVVVPVRFCSEEHRRLQQYHCRHVLPKKKMTASCIWMPATAPLKPLLSVALTKKQQQQQQHAMRNKNNNNNCIELQLGRQLSSLNRRSNDDHEGDDDSSSLSSVSQKTTATTRTAKTFSSLTTTSSSSSSTSSALVYLLSQHPNENDSHSDVFRAMMKTKKNAFPVIETQNAFDDDNDDVDDMMITPSRSLLVPRTITFEETLASSPGFDTDDDDSLEEDDDDWGIYVPIPKSEMN